MTTQNIKCQLSISILLCFILLNGCFSSNSKPKPRKGDEIVSHTIREGDTLTTIARRYNSSINEIVDLNGLDDPDIIEPGNIIRVPVRLSSKPKAPYSSGQLAWPVEGGEVVSNFGPRIEGFHDGLDIAARTGTPVFAAHSGTVVYSNNKLGGYGEVIIIKSSSSLISVYAHNSERLVHEGDHVRRGQQIAEVGATGHTSGPHLHFEVRVKDPKNHYVAVDPLPLFKNSSKPALRYRVNDSLSPILAKVNSWKSTFSPN